MRSSLSVMEGRVVGVASRSPIRTVKGFHVVFTVYIHTLYYPLSQVRVRNVKFTETDRIAHSSSNLAQSRLRVKRIIANNDSREERSKGLADIGNLFLLSFGVEHGKRIKFCRLSELNEAEFPFV